MTYHSKAFQRFNLRLHQKVSMLVDVRNSGLTSSHHELQTALPVTLPILVQRSDYEAISVSLSVRENLVHHRDAIVTHSPRAIAHQPIQLFRGSTNGFRIVSIEKQILRRSEDPGMKHGQRDRAWPAFLKQEAGKVPQSAEA